MKCLNIARVEEPVLVSGRSGGSLNVPSEYKGRTTPLPSGPRGINWRGYFNDQLKGPLVAYHDGTAITVHCDTDDYPDWLELVDAAIEKANEKEGAIPYAGNV